MNVTAIHDPATCCRSGPASCCFVSCRNNGATTPARNPDIDKCLFVVDRKDLDRQTREEFNKFQEGCVEENTNTETLVRRLLSDDYADKVIVTTIQKLGLALDGTNKRNYKERLESLRNQRMVFIFDECHRSQFGENHQAIKEFFPNAQLFGFTGTPIFDQNASYQQVTNPTKRKMPSKPSSPTTTPNTVARFGGDEFVVMLRELGADKGESASQARIVAEKIRIALAEPYLLTVMHEGQADSAVEHHCTTSIGVVLFINNVASQDDIIKWADAAMYQAKQAGRNSIRFYDAKA
jgi:hypothetical protein